MLPPRALPDLVGADGRFRRDMVACAVDIAFRPAARRQLFAEVTAQFERFAATGLPLDHVNTHKHFHLHPTIMSTILEVGGRHGMDAMRVPAEPRAVLRAAEPGVEVAPRLCHRAVVGAGAPAPEARGRGVRRTRSSACTGQGP